MHVLVSTIINRNGTAMNGIQEKPQRLSQSKTTVVSKNLFSNTYYILKTGVALKIYFIPTPAVSSLHSTVSDLTA
jgi:hypothetical protein